MVNSLGRPVPPGTGVLHRNCSRLQPAAAKTAAKTAAATAAAGWNLAAGNPARSTLAFAAMGLVARRSLLEQETGLCVLLGALAVNPPDILRLNPNPTHSAGAHSRGSERGDARGVGDLSEALRAAVGRSGLHRLRRVTPAQVANQRSNSLLITGDAQVRHGPSWSNDWRARRPARRPRPRRRGAPGLSEPRWENERRSPRTQN